MDYTKLLFSRDAGVATLTLNRPERANAFDETLTAELQDALKQAEKDTTIRCVVLTGAGKAFCAGQDLGAFTARYESSDKIGFREHLQKGYNQIVMRLRTMEKPVIAAVNGAVAGAGLGIACACDIRIASENARFRMAFIGIGLAPDSGTSFMLPRLIGFGRALEMAITNELIDAPKALEYGLVTRVVSAEELLPMTIEFAQQLANAPTRGIGLTKRAFNRALVSDLEATLDYEAQLQDIAGATLDHREGVKAFIEKRAASYQGK